MNLTGSIESAELKFKQILEAFFVSVYNDESLPSHGLDHHRRVWNYAKNLVISISENYNIIDPSLPEKLIIACYLHDIGMSVDPGTKHGHHSKDLCIKFLNTHHLNESSYEDLLSAIENHDNKEYKSISNQYDLLTILSVADDLDALGFVGIYRYIEIYLTRGLNREELGHHILKNATLRFENLIRTFGTIDSILRLQTERFNILKDFFNNYNSQVKSYNFDGQNPTGYCGVIELLSVMIKERKGLEELCIEIENTYDNQVIKWFFKNLDSEFKNCHQDTKTPENTRSL